MREIKILMIGSLIVLSVEGYYLIRNAYRDRVLGEREVATIAPTIIPTPTPTEEPTPSPEPTPTETPTPTPIPQPTFSSQQINEFIDRFAGQYNVDPHLLRHIAICESGFRPNAVSPAGYVGLYQFGPITWRNIRKEMGEDTDPALRANAEEAVQTAAYNLHINNAGIWPNCVR